VRSRAKIKVVAEANAMTPKQIEAAAIKLPKRDRARLAKKLLDSIPMKPDERDRDVMAAWMAEVELRIDEFESGKVTGIPADKVFKRVRASLRR
jgi:putative addiction module component (TIGR02574 family)